MARWVIIFILLTLFSLSIPKRTELYYENTYSDGRGAILLTFNGYKPAEPAFLFEELKPSGLTDGQKLDVQRRVAEYYSMFDVVVTTDDSLFYTFPQRLRVRCTITGDSILLGNGFAVFYVGGVSQYNALFLSDTTTAIVSSSSLEYNSRYIADAVAHEVGHTLGLAHQSTWFGAWKYAEYSVGDSCEAPIMGRSYDAEKAVWVIGVNAFGQYQDDIEIISRTFRKIW